MKTYVTRGLIFFPIILVTACGGNGNSDGVGTEAQAIEFSELGPIKLLTGDQYTNLAVGE